MTYSEQIKTAYETLGLKVGATAAQVNSAYKQIAKKYHPDINHDNLTPEEIEHRNDLLVQANAARKTLLDYFAIEAEKAQVTPEEEAEAITLMYASALKSDMKKVSYFLTQTNNAMRKIINDFGAQTINIAAPLFDYAKKLFNEQSENLNKYSAHIPRVSPSWLKAQTNNIKSLGEYITVYDNLSKFLKGILPDIFAEPQIDAIPTIDLFSTRLNDGLTYLYDRVQENGLADIKDMKSLDSFLDTCFSFFRGPISDMLPRWTREEFDSELGNFLKLVSIINKMPDDLKINELFGKYDRDQSYGIYYELNKWCKNFLDYAFDNTTPEKTPLTPKYIREYIESLGGLVDKAKSFEEVDHNITLLDEINASVKTAEEIEKMMKLPHYNDIFKQIYNDVWFGNVDSYEFLITEVIENINIFRQKLLIKALFDKEKTLTKSEQQFLEFGKEYLAYADKYINDPNWGGVFNEDYKEEYKKAYESANYILETLDGIKSSGVDINNAKEVEKFVADKFNKSVYNLPKEIINITKHDYGKEAAKKMALMLIEASIKYDIDHPEPFNLLSGKFNWVEVIPLEELFPIIYKYKDNLQIDIVIKGINETKDLNIEPTPPPPTPPPAPAQTLSR
ncbi:MAG: J domain-containing protein [Clostridiales bacterium]|jgi:curved DNA-binding protein CbpA|nr:J domain-containing protein [Clostridiales bacterium]